MSAALALACVLTASSSMARADADHALLSRLGDAIVAEDVPAVSEALERVLARWPKERATNLAGAFACIDALLTEGRLASALEARQVRVTDEALTRLRASLSRCTEDGPPRIDRRSLESRAAALARAAPAVADLVALQDELDQRLQGDFETRRQATEANAAELVPIRRQLAPTTPPPSELWPRIRAVWRWLDPPEPTRADLPWPRRSSGPQIATVVLGIAPVVLAVPGPRRRARAAAGAMDRRRRGVLRPRRRAGLGERVEQPVAEALGHRDDPRRAQRRGWSRGDRPR